MDIVFLLDAYHPHRKPSANCADIYIQKLKKSHNVIVVAPSTINDSMRTFDIEGVTVYTITNYWNSLRNYCMCHIKEGKNVLFFQMLLFLVRGYGLFLSLFSFPSRFAWLIQGYIKVVESLLHRQKIDVVISVSDPICTHVAAQKIKQRYPHIKWITYTTDPFTYSERNKKRLSCIKKKNFNLEYLIYKSSDSNIFTQELYNFNIGRFHIQQHNNLCFPYVFSEFPVLQLNTKGILKSSRHTMFYAGALMKKIRNPEFALSVLSKVKCFDVFLFVAGDCSNIIQRYQTDNIYVNGLLHRDKYVKVITDEADVLINIGNVNDLQSPSKFMELLSTGKPIINFYVKKDSNYFMIEKYPLGINVGKDVVSPVDEVLAFCNTNIGKKMSRKALDALFPEHRLGLQLDRLEQLLNENDECSNEES